MATTGSRETKGRSGLMRLLFAIMVVQLVFWFILQPFIFTLNDGDFERYEATGFEEAAIDRPEYAALADAEFRSLDEIPAWNCCELGYRALRYTVELDEIPPQGLGIRPRINADNRWLYVNGSFIAGYGRMKLPDITYHAQQRETYHIPASALKPGKNEFAFVLVRDASPYFDYYAPVIGEYSLMTAQQAQTMFFLGLYKYMALAVIGLVALLALIVALRAEDKRQPVWFFLLAANWTLLTAYYMVPDPPVGGMVRLSWYFCSSLFLSVAWFGFANAWGRHRWRWGGPAALAIFVIAATAIVLSLTLLPSGPNFDRAGQIHDYTAIILSLATLARIGWSFRDGGDDRHWEAAIMALLAVLLAMAALRELTLAMTSGYLTKTQPFLIAGLAIAFFARNVRLFQSSAQINALLTTQLDERTAELEEAHQRQQALVRRQAHADERQRIMRDMHDGLGSQLMSLLMMARRGKAQPGDFEEGIQQVIDEMRLMIDSMDSVGESLGSALAIFNRRVMPRVQAAGLDYDWRVVEGVTYPDLGPRDVLQVFRVMQEAVTNALKHSGADRLSVSVAPAGAGLRIAIADNGKGMPEQPGKGLSRGRGLENMARRAGAIGALLAVEPLAGGGTVVTLDLPPARPGYVSEEGAGQHG
ncbi:MAG: hypothetical protein H6918_09630 [Sphingomonadaceae bacterium]|nr:hypothetical protein [Sphingomonadaceae bacterium]